MLRFYRVVSLSVSHTACRAHRHHPHPPNVQFVRPPPQPSVRLRKMQYSHPQVESEWRTQFHSRQLSSDTLFSTAGLAYGAATTSKLFATLPAGAAAPHLTVALLALSQYVVLGMIVGTLLARWAARLQTCQQQHGGGIRAMGGLMVGGQHGEGRSHGQGAHDRFVTAGVPARRAKASSTLPLLCRNWYAWARPRLVWTLPIFFGCSSSHWSAGGCFCRSAGWRCGRRARRQVAAALHCTVGVQQHCTTAQLHPWDLLVCSCLPTGDPLRLPVVELPEAVVHPRQVADAGAAGECTCRADLLFPL